VSSELSELVAAPSQTVCFLARTYNDAIQVHYRSDTQVRPVSGCPQPTPPLYPRPPAAVARPVTAVAGTDSSGESSRRVRLASGESPFVETLINLTLHSQLQNVELMNVDEMLELAATILQTHCDDRCEKSLAHRGLLQLPHLRLLHYLMYLNAPQAAVQPSHKCACAKLLTSMQVSK